MRQKREELPPVHVNNDAEMVGLRLRRPRLRPRDQSVWTKTDKEKEELRKWRCRKFIFSGWAAPIVPSGFTGKLIVYLKNLPRVEKKDNELVAKVKNTLSFTCDITEIDSILRDFRNREDKIEVVKYSWNGRTYGRDEVPPRINRSGRIKA